MTTLLMRAPVAGQPQPGAGHADASPSHAV